MSGKWYFCPKLIVFQEEYGKARLGSVSLFGFCFEN